MERGRVRASVAAVVLTVAVGVASAAGANVVGPDQGCTPGYWKNHTESWQEYTATTKLQSLFTIPANLASFRTETMLDALQGGGGPGLTGAVTILVRAAAAAYLNAAHDGVGFPLRRSLPSPYAPWSSDPRFAAGMRGAVSNALASGDRTTILDLATVLDDANNLGCPLN